VQTYDDLAGKVVLVTGANGGMGSAISAALVASGAAVVASDVGADPGERLAGVADDIQYVPADVASVDDVVRLVGHATGQLGRLDAAVNAAAIEYETVRLSDCDEADFDRIVGVNLRGTFLCMKYELRAMLDQGDGSIVNLASTTSFRPGRRQSAYTATKHAVVGLTRAAAADYAGDGIRVNAIAPGNIDTPMLRAAIERRGGDLDSIQARMPMGRFGEAAEIAQAALWLCSSASSFTTGDVIQVEGGMLVS
jgi:NAD(P)-dependent dehydrogenase (short-subunit alcohol dehydrogenase family)